MKYIAFLQGINVGKRRVKMVDLKQLFSDLGFENIQTILASGNVIFETESNNKNEFEERIEQGVSDKFGFESNTIVINKSELERILIADPFGTIALNKTTRPYISFLENPNKIGFEHLNDNVHEGFSFIKVESNYLCSIIDHSKAGSPDLMHFLDQNFGKAVTTRSLKTVEKIQKKLQ